MRREICHGQTGFPRPGRARGRDHFGSDGCWNSSPDACPLSRIIRARSSFKRSGSGPRGSGDRIVRRTTHRFGSMVGVLSWETLDTKNPCPGQDGQSRAGLLTLHKPEGASLRRVYCIWFVSLHVRPKDRKREDNVSEVTAKHCPGTSNHGCPKNCGKSWSGNRWPSSTSSSIPLRPAPNFRTNVVAGM